MIRPTTPSGDFCHPPIADGSLDGGILITIHRLSHGGADRVAVHLANGLTKAGFRVGIAILRDCGEGERPLLSLIDKGVLVGHAGKPMASRHLELFRGWRYLRNLAATARPAVVLASSNNMGLVTGLSRKHGDTRPTYVMKATNPVIRPEDRTSLKKLYRRRLYGFVFGSFNRVLVLSEGERETLDKLYPRHADKFRVVINPYVTPNMLRDIERPLDGPPTVVTLARMMPQKRLDVLLAAFARMGVPDARLIILGDGPERSRLEALARTLGIEDRVNMPGFAEDVIPCLRTAELLALSSDYEGLPAVVFEALACNVPVVTTDSFDEARSLLDGVPRSAVVPLGDIEALARAMEKSLRDRADTPLNLRPFARAYGFDAAISSHLDALRPFLTLERA